MARAVWKGTSVGSIKNKIIWKRGSRILYQNVGQLYKVYNGQKFNEILIEEGMVGKCFGDFSISRRMGVDIHIKKRKKKEKK